MIKTVIYYEKKKQYVRADNPEILIKFLDRRKKDLEEKREKLQKRLPELKSIYNRPK